MNLTEFRVFLLLAEELHFGRAAERAYMSQPQVSRLIASLEHRIGGTLIQRTSRSVRLTPLGERLRDRLIPAYQGLHDVLSDAREASQSTAGELRIGCTPTTSGFALTRLIASFEARHPECAVTVWEQPFSTENPLPGGAVDVMANWLVPGQPELTYGPAIDRNERVLAVATTHPLAHRTSVSIEDVADYRVPDFTPRLSPEVLTAISPSRTPSGRPIARGPAARTANEIFDLVARGHVIHPTNTAVAATFSHRRDIVWIPIPDLPLVPLGLIWVTAHHNARIQALADTARHIGPHTYR